MMLSLNDSRVREVVLVYPAFTDGKQALCRTVQCL